jgi:hypothetical protein
LCDLWVEAFPVEPGRAKLSPGLIRFTVHSGPLRGCGERFQLLQANAQATVAEFVPAQHDRETA